MGRAILSAAVLGAIIVPLAALIYGWASSGPLPRTMFSVVPFFMGAAIGGAVLFGLVAALWGGIRRR